PRPDVAAGRDARRLRTDRGLLPDHQPRGLPGRLRRRRGRQPDHGQGRSAADHRLHPSRARTPPGLAQRAADAAGLPRGALGADHQVDSDAEVEQLVDTSADMGRQVVRAHLEEGQSLTVRKAVAYHSSRSVPHRELFDRCRRTLDRVRRTSFEAQHLEQREYLEDFWRSSDVELPGQPAAQQATRWCLFQLAQAAARSDQWGIPAKGVTGSGYEGHYFWD